MSTDPGLSRDDTDVNKTVTLQYTAYRRVGNTNNKQVIKCEEWSQRRKTSSHVIQKLIWRSHLILQEIPLHGELSMWENVIMFLKRAIKSSLARMGDCIFRTTNNWKGYICP